MLNPSRIERILAPFYPAKALLDVEWRTGFVPRLEVLAGMV